MEGLEKLSDKIGATVLTVSVSTIFSIPISYLYLCVQHSKFVLIFVNEIVTKIGSCLLKFGTAELILTLTQLGIKTEGKPDIVSNKRKLIKWIQKAYEDLMEDVDKEPEER